MSSGLTKDKIKDEIVKIMNLDKNNIWYYYYRYYRLLEVKR